ncbi:phage tail sheath family protein [Anaerotruncus sp. 1XD42-93]|uniref:phage tail sheath family protein n=1 Tax=Anaerotruncus sp. 1XD42-93 TaxID=2320853 RepID=UPI000EA27545|nr:phage tail sheath family protein [Anaerotruncus sp. 1XD42-93]NBK18608.1 phage tail protein [Anaerotruncus sp. 1XD42-93]RKJ79784.1 phage tail protein [Anaerotruncus sp. 1XD22-93]
MALGGGTFLVQNKKLPGSYINFVSLPTASATLSDRGTVTMPLALDWGPDDAVFTVENGDFIKHSMKYFGYDYTSEKLKGLRDLFMNAITLHAYRLNGGGKKAANAYATARYSGTRGNDLITVISANVDEPELFDVSTYMGVDQIETQTVTEMKELFDNDYVKWNTDAVLQETAGMPLEGGTNGEVTGGSYQKYLDAIEKYTFNAMGVVTTDNTVKSLFSAFVKRMRDEVGMKFQLVLHRYTKPDYMGAVSVENICTDGAQRVDGKMVHPDEAALVYWVTGVEGGIAVNKSAMNKKYDGEYTVDVNYTQKELENAIDAGRFIFHQVGDDVRVLEDINTFVTTSDTMGDVFKSNQTIHVCDQIANDVAVVFNTKYLGVVPNDADGRTSLWADIVKLHQQLQDIRAIENFEDTDITIAQGDTKMAVVVEDAITVINAMGKLYMTVTVS